MKSDEAQSYQETRTKIPLSIWILFFLIDFLILIFIVGYVLMQPPREFSTEPVTIEPGTSALEISKQLEEQNVVRSFTLLYITLLTLYEPSDLKAGMYVFDEPSTVFDVANTLANTVPQEDAIKVTFPEGFTHFEYNELVPEAFATTTDLTEYEGTLFPDTYFIPTSYSSQDVLSLLQETQTERLQPLQEAIAASNFTEEEVLILASIIEREANDETSMRLVSGILQTRLAIGMALQVDASVAYGLGKPGTQLTRTDIETDGPFNTYTRPGLPPTAIANPGLQAIEAVLNPTPSDYLYYITGNDGNFYYAETLDQHNDNIARYLR